MTGDDLAAALYAEQGFLVIESSHKTPIGEIVKATNLLPLETPLRIVAEGDRSQFLSQAQRVRELSDQDPRISREPAPGFFYYYRVEAAD